ncbi:hypothetical protein BRADI_4g02665v3 [Brachypodium distachyon]|uniref:BHLH domain-containing protein n=1 Tax=Brachypodium distachyon TaxID=15368 RepID=A0A0Q3GYM3_BRADI|nr:hypothetical protein BRADI_4g02665v3 [Brachypodium distachyon]
MQRRRDKINDKMRTLQQLMPTCTKTDKASTLEEVIQYIKSLQYQMQVLSNGYGVPTAISPPSGMVSTTSMQPVRDAFGGRRATSVALPPYPFSPTAFACPHYGNGMPLPVPYRDQIGSMYAAQQLAHRRQQT